jgi:cell division protein FtsL
MGLPALQHDTHTAAARRPHLRVVRPQPKSSSRKRRAAQTHAAVLQYFVFFAVVVVLVTVLGLGRVWLSVQAAQASIDSGRLRRDIKLEQYQGDMLEVQESALATPSRIQAIAGATMDMAPAASVSYLDLRGEPASNPAGGLASANPVPNAGLSGAFAQAMEVAASEARVLLVGDVGLASSR